MSANITAQGAQGAGDSGTRPIEGSATNEEVIQSLRSEIQMMRQTMAAQDARIENLLTLVEQGTVNQGSSGNAGEGSCDLRSIKAPQLCSYAGNHDERTSTKVKSFIYNVRKVGRLSGFRDQKMVELADCYLQDRAAVWMMGLERNNQKPRTVDELQTAMLREFVPQNERARAKARLMKIKQSSTMDSYISSFRDLVELCETPLSEAYLFFFNGLTDRFKEEFCKKYPTGEPNDLQEVYDHARVLDLAKQWSSGNMDTRPKDRRPDIKGVKKDINLKKARGEKTMMPEKDPKDPIWGPSDSKQRNHYRKHNRCFECGAAWEPGHRCSIEESNQNGLQVAGRGDNPKGQRRR